MTSHTAIECKHMHGENSGERGTGMEIISHISWNPLCQTSFYLLFQLYTFSMKISLMLILMDCYVSHLVHLNNCDDGVCKLVRNMQVVVFIPIDFICDVIVLVVQLQ